MIILTRSFCFGFAVPPDAGIIGIDLGSIRLAAAAKVPGGGGALSALRAVPGLGSSQLAFVHSSGKWYCGEEHASSSSSARGLRVKFAKLLLGEMTARLVDVLFIIFTSSSFTS